MTQGRALAQSSQTGRSELALRVLGLLCRVSRSFLHCLHCMKHGAHPHGFLDSHSLILPLSQQDGAAGQQDRERCRVYRAACTLSLVPGYTSSPNSPPPPAPSCLYWNMPPPPVHGQVGFFPDLSPCRHPSFLSQVHINSCSCHRPQLHPVLSLSEQGLTLGCLCLGNVPFSPRRLAAPQGLLSPAALPLTTPDPFP